jgi:hypothetical protein
VRARPAITALAAAVALAGCGEDVGVRGDSSSLGGSARPQPPPPRVDAHAGAPAYVASVGGRAVLLDRRGRVRRVLPGHSSDPYRCGERRLIQAGAWEGRVTVRGLGGRRLWRQRIPVDAVHAAACLDRRGAAVAVVTEPDRGVRKVLHTVTARGRRPVLRFLGEVPLITPDVMYVSDGGELRLHDPATGRVLRTLAVPAHAHKVLPSPDGTRLALVSLTEEDPRWDRSHVLDLGTGEVRPIERPWATALGWLGDDRLVVGSGLRMLHVLDERLRTVATVESFPTEGAIVAGDQVVSRRARRLLAAGADDSEPRVLGRVPRRTFLDFAL